MAVKAALILAAGRGERMRPLTDHTPKPLLRAGGRALIEWHLSALRAAGVDRVVINTAHLGEQIESALGDGARYGVHIVYSREETALETAGGIANALPAIDADPFIVVNGDVVCDYPFNRLSERASRLKASNVLAHLVLIANPEHHPGGDFVLLADAKSESIAADESPSAIVAEEGGKKLTYSGIALYRRQLFDAITPGQRAPLAPLLRTAMRQNKVSGERYAGLWLDVGTPERLAQADRLLSQRGLEEKH